MQRFQKLTGLALCLCLMLSLTACGIGGAAEAPAPPTMSPAPDVLADTEAFAQTAEAPTNILVAYFSRTGVNYKVGNIDEGNTALLASMIAETVGGDLFEIVPETPYPDDFDETSKISLQEQQDDARPAYTGDVESWAQYDVVFLGYPIWWGDMPMILYTFLESHDFTGKTVVPFCTHEGSSLAGTVKTIADLCPNATVEAGLAVQGQRVQEEQEPVRQEAAAFLGSLDLSN